MQSVQRTTGSRSYLRISMQLTDYSKFSYHPKSEVIVNVLRKVNQNTESDSYFRVLGSFYVGQVASTMRASVTTEDRGVIPVNIYALCLAASGFGKTKSVNILERELLGGFYQSFTEDTLPEIANDAIQADAIKRANKNNSDFEDELPKLETEYDSYGAYVFAFPEGSGPAFRQIRAKCQMANIGSTNLIIDELGYNLIKSTELLDIHFECYTGDVEVLTSKGYIRFDELTGSEDVAQYSENGVVSYVPNSDVGFIKKPYDGKVFDLVTPTGFDFTVTENHQNTVVNYKGEFQKKTASELDTSSRIIISKCAEDRGEHISDLLRLQIAFQADGTFKRNKVNVEFGFTKERKIARLHALLGRMGVEYKNYHLSTGHTVFSFKKEGLGLTKDLRDVIEPEKLDLTSIREILDEAVKWDGNEKEMTNRYTTAHLGNAQLIAWIASLSGHKSRMRTVVDNRSNRFSDSHYVEWNTRLNHPSAQLSYLDKCSGNQKPIRTSRHYEGHVYCVTVPSTHIVIRRNGVSCIGGNCYDVGLVKDKITKSSSDNKRHTQRSTPVPSNFLAFGTPDKLFDGSVTEKELIARLDSGYGRRFIYAEGTLGEDESISPAELYDRLVNGSNSTDLDNLRDLFTRLADPVNAHRNIPMEREQGILLTTYKMECEYQAKSLPAHQNIHKAELQHRYFRALKIAGAYAFVDSTPIVTTAQLMAAIRVVEDSGSDFQRMIARPKPHVRLAKYIASVSEEVTHADLIEDLAFYPNAKNKQEEMITMANAWGYKNNIIIKKYYNSGIEFFKGESLKETNLDEMMFSVSDHEAYNYAPMVQPFSNLSKLTQAQGMHWCSHSFEGNHRNGDNVIKGFNMVVIDVDKGIALPKAKKLLEEFTAHYYVTKRHTPESHRFRIVIPMKYHLNLNEKEFKEFMYNIYEWLPFEVDEGTDQRSKKWLSHKGGSGDNIGELFDPTPFIPKTSKNTQRQADMKKLGNLGRIESWFARNELVEGNRNNGLSKYCFMLLDSGLDPQDCEDRTLEFNEKLPEPLKESELRNTVFKSMWEKVKTK